MLYDEEKKIHENLLHSEAVHSNVSFVEDLRWCPRVQNDQEPWSASLTASVSAVESVKIHRDFNVGRSAKTKTITNDRVTLSELENISDMGNINSPVSSGSVEDFSRIVCRPLKLSNGRVSLVIIGHTFMIHQERNSCWSILVVKCVLFLLTLVMW